MTHDDIYSVTVMLTFVLETGSGSRVSNYFPV